MNSIPLTTLRTALFLLFTVVGVSIALQGCATGHTKVVNGVYHHVDTWEGVHRDCVGVEGCHWQIGDTHHISYSITSPAYVVPHELAHVDGMRHTEWTNSVNEKCATVYQASKGYPFGSKICIDGKRERVS